VVGEFQEIGMVGVVLEDFDLWCPSRHVQMADQAPTCVGSLTRVSSTSPAHRRKPPSLSSVVRRPVFHLPSGRRVARKVPVRQRSGSVTR
jgi:hypothetical protein